MIRSMPYSAGWRDVRDKTRRNGTTVYEARWSDETGEARGKTFYTKAAARKYANEMGDNVERAAVGLAVLIKPLDAALDAFAKQYSDYGTLALYERHLTSFLEWKPLKFVHDLTSQVVLDYHAYLRAKGHNAGGQRIILKTLRTLTKFCISQKWLSRDADPFEGLTLPESEFEGRALTPEEFAQMIAIDPRFSKDSRYPSDYWLNLALRVGNSLALRLSQIWKLRAEDFREPDLVYVEGIKKQSSVWTPVIDADGLAALREALAQCPPGERLFRYFKRTDGMRRVVRDKATRAGLKGVRFHDASKVTAVSSWSKRGLDIAELSKFSNTSRRTLVDHYIKADRDATFEKMRKINAAADLPQTYKGPEKGVNTGKQVQVGLNVANEKSAESEVISTGLSSSVEI